MRERSLMLLKTPREGGKQVKEGDGVSRSRISLSKENHGSY